MAMSNIKTNRRGNVQLGKTVMPVTLFIGQVVAMLSIIPMALYANLWQWGLCILMYQLIVTIGISVGYHRYFSHRMFKCPIWFEYVMLFFANIMMVGPATLWVANHREHHKYTDTDKDPHSPSHKGYFYAHFLQVFTSPKIKFMTDLLRDNKFKLQHKYFWEINIVWMLLLLAIDPFAVIYLWLAPAGISKIFGSLVYSYSHRGGKPNSDVWVGLLSGGEGFHEPHHDANKRSYRWHKYDIGGLFIERAFNGKA